MKTNRRATINKTSTPNFYDVISSNNFDHYPLLVTGPGQAICGCPAGEAHRGCYHRQTALQTLKYVPIIEDSIDNETWRRIELRAEWESTLDSVRDLFTTGPEAA